MTRIKLLCDQIADELCSAKDYAEEYLTLKSKGMTERAKVYHTMALQEIEHSNNLHNVVSAEIEELAKTYTPPVDMKNAWEKSHKTYIERSAWIKTMLSM